MKLIYPGCLRALIVLLLCFLPRFALAGDRHFRVNGRLEGFSDFPEIELLISKSCLRKTGISCEAYSAAKNATLIPENNSKIANANPVSAYCAHVGGSDLIGIDEATGGELYMCSFRDGSLIDDGSIAAFAIRNSKK